ncbi:MAG: aminoacetone oxidase family FAD-binding enzyme [Kiritimatiellae bacterium]|nr:aminoacetone oxidase family FAD-binding enzyme [Kiritimatiellia bacterium]
MALKHAPAKLAIVGGGAAGMAAAVSAAGMGLGCVVIERKARLGSKMLMTANGRCNFTKDIPPEQFIADIGECGGFASRAIREFGPRRIMSAFRSLGVRLRRMADGRMFPADGKAATIVHAFGDLMREREVPVMSNCPVTAIRPQKNGFIVATKNFTLWAENVLLATGGYSYPKTGSVGDGQEIARRLGHRIVAPRAGLIGMETADGTVVALAGRRFEDGCAKVVSPGGETLFEYAGEVDCESFGVSGAAVYNCQRFAAHRNLGDFVLEVRFGQNAVRLRNPKPRPLKEAIVTIGGVATDEIDPGTMESRLVPHLYFAGEVMDIDGPTGGYNLTLAFATARKAVMSICKN